MRAATAAPAAARSSPLSVDGVEQGTRPRPAGCCCSQWYGDGLYLFSYTAGAGATQRDIVGVCAPSGEDTPPVSGENFDWTPERQQAAVLGALEGARGLPEEARAVARAAERTIRIGLFTHEPLPEWSTGRVRWRPAELQVAVQELTRLAGAPRSSPSSATRRTRCCR